MADECPTCPDGGVDLSRGLFSQLADTSVGVLEGSGASWGWAKKRDLEADENDEDI